MRKFNLSKYALECFSNNILKVSGIVDKPQGKLSDIFEPGSITLKSVVKNNIDLALSRIQEFLDKTYAGIKVTRHEIIGAAVTFQYTDTSDIDTTVFININRSDPRFKSINNWIGTYIDGKMTYNKRPYQFKIMPDSTKSQTGQADAIYDPVSGSFLKPPQKSKSQDDFKELIYNKSDERKQYERMEEKLRGMARSWAKVGRKVLSSKDSISDSYKWLLPQAKEIIIVLKNISDTRSDSYSSPIQGERQSQNWGTGNILFKFIERDGYLELFKLIKHAMEDEKLNIFELRESVTLAEKIMNQNLGYNPND